MAKNTSTSKKSGKNVPKSDPISKDAKELLRIQKERARERFDALPEDEKERIRSKKIKLHLKEEV